jgi:hypothetical protein
MVIHPTQRDPFQPERREETFPLSVSLQSKKIQETGTSSFNGYKKENCNHFLLRKNNTKPIFYLFRKCE